MEEEMNWGSQLNLHRSTAGLPPPATKVFLVGGAMGGWAAQARGCVLPPVFSSSVQKSGNTFRSQHCVLTNMFTFRFKEERVFGAFPGCPMLGGATVHDAGE